MPCNALAGVPGTICQGQGGWWKGEVRKQCCTCSPVSSRALIPPGWRGKAQLTGSISYPCKACKRAWKDAQMPRTSLEPLLELSQTKQ